MLGSSAKGGDIGGTAEKHDRAQLVFDSFKKLDRAFPPVLCQRDEDIAGEACGRCAECDRACGVEAVSHAAGGDRVHAAGDHVVDAGRRWNAPVPEQLTKASRVALGAKGFDPHPGGATCAARVDGANTGVVQRLRGLRADPVAGLFADDGYLQLADEARDGVASTSKVAIPARLDELHGRVHVHTERIRTDCAEHIGDHLGRHFARLHDAYISKQKRVRCVLSDFKRPGRIRSLLHGALAAQAKAVAVFFRDGCERLVDLGSAFVAASHRRDDDGGFERLAEQLDREVDRIEVDVGQRLMDESNTLEERRALLECHSIGGTEIEVVGFALFDVGRHAECIRPTRGQVDRALVSTDQASWLATRATSAYIPAVSDFSDWLTEVRDGIDAHLAAYLKSKIQEADALSADSVELVDGVRSLTMRGGKRFRPMLVEAAFVSIAGESKPAVTQPAGAALEMLQSYLLIHDDWMDQDDERRGGPAVHAMYRERYDRHLADSLGILAGDLASAYSLELLLNADVRAERMGQALAVFVQIQKEVFFGQHLDITANANVAKMHDLKTGSYTVRGPLLLGATLAGASDEQKATLVKYANPLGHAFQIRDDLLGTFGDQGTTGKPGNDLRNGKRTSLVGEVESLLKGDALKPIDVVMAGGASETQIAEAAELLITSGARANVEARLAAHLEAATAVLEGDVDPKGHLRGLAGRLAVRSD